MDTAARLGFDYNALVRSLNFIASLTSCGMATHFCYPSGVTHRRIRRGVTGWSQVADDMLPGNRVVDIQSNVLAAIYRYRRRVSD